ncbi:unnamed protein product [Spirodela intermedia]|uniref:Glycosyltransferase n=1 Tax=Spirodela intermedia TaxID=51605 RepID=A0A7I8ILZ9_SPIIN|nr:unnamed protein product [Spirodela intermedia]CAA6658779.1 unnamed protein product [Spirodela intermedia]
MEAPDVDVFFLPYMVPGHYRPMVGIAKLFATRGARASVVAAATDPAALRPLLDWTDLSGRSVQFILLPSSSSSMADLGAVLREPLRRLLREQPPVCLVFDAFFPWAIDVAEEVGVPTFTFHGSSCFTSCCYKMLGLHPPPPQADPVVVPGLPHRVELLRTQLADSTVPFIAAIFSKITESKSRSDGMLVNSFYELEADVWPIGPLSLLSDVAATAARDAGEDAGGSLRWLDGKKPGSVVYICFGSMAQLSGAQLGEIGAALETMECPFIWVTAGGKESRGILITGWAPQNLILGHAAVGAFMTHCGWNSCLEAVAAGVPMVTWPLMAEQFFNEKLVTQVLGAGVGVGSRVWTMNEEERDLIGREDIRRAIARVIDGGEEAAALRRRAAELASSARKAVAEGGSSYENVGCLIDQLRRGEWCKLAAAAGP